VPELPDTQGYIEVLEARGILVRRLERVRLASAFVLRSVEPPVVPPGRPNVVGLRRMASAS